MPDEEDNISLVRFDEKLLRKAFQPSNVSVTEPSWLQHEQPLRIASDLKKAHKRKSKRKRDKDAPNPTTEETSAQKKVKLEQTANA